MLDNVLETVGECSWKAFENAGQWKIGIGALSCWFQITGLSCINVACIPHQCNILHMQSEFYALFPIFSQKKSKCILWVNALFLISWLSMRYLLKSVIAEFGLVLKKVDILQYAPLVFRLQAPNEGLCSQPANLSSWLVLVEELPSFLLQFHLIHRVILLSPQTGHALPCNEIIMSSLAFLLYTRPHFLASTG